MRRSKRRTLRGLPWRSQWRAEGPDRCGTALRHASACPRARCKDWLRNFRDYLRAGPRCNSPAAA
eukprot:12693222-Alexandrium_andersonii.AAC.1